MNFNFLKNDSLSNRHVLPIWNIIRYEINFKKGTPYMSYWNKINNDLYW
jgi:hypothetical protein